MKRSMFAAALMANSGSPGLRRHLGWAEAAFSPQCRSSLHHGQMTPQQAQRKRQRHEMATGWDCRGGRSGKWRPLYSSRTADGFDVGAVGTPSVEPQRNIPRDRPNTGSVSLEQQLHFDVLDASSGTADTTERSIPSSEDANSPARTDHARSFRRRSAGLARAASLNPYRIIHSALGLASILLGAYHLVEIGLIHTFALAVPRDEVVLTASVHVACGAMGVHRLNVGSEREGARNAMIWPVPIQNAWLGVAALTEWGGRMGASLEVSESAATAVASLSMFGAPFAVFTAFNLLLTLWQLSEVWNKTGLSKDDGGRGAPATTDDVIWFDAPWKNALLTEFAYALWMQLQMGAALFTSQVVEKGALLNFMAEFPNMGHILTNLALNTCFFNNLTVFLATLLRYRVLSLDKRDNVIMFSVPLLTSAFVVWKVFDPFFSGGDGEMSGRFLALLLNQER